MTTTKPDLKTIDFLFSKISEGVAYCKIIVDDTGNPVDWVYLDVNDAYEEINGVRKTDIIGKRATEVLPNIRNDPGNWMHVYGQVALTGKSVVTERYADVRKKWYHVSAYSPEKGYFVSIFEDISERKKIEQSANQQRIVQEGINKILQAALSGTEEALGEVCLAVAEELTQSKFGFIGELNPKGLEDIAISNPGWDACKIITAGGHRRPPGQFKIHGIYGRVLIDGKGFYTNDPSHHPDSIGLPNGHPPLTSFLGVPLKSDSKTIGMIAVGNREGGYRDTELHALEGLAPIIVEAFERKRAEENFKETEQRLRVIFENSRDGINLLDLKTGKYVFMSPAQVALTGFTAEEINNISAEEAYERTYPEDREITVTQQKRVIAGEDVPPVEYRWKVKSGEYRWFSDSRKLVRDQKGQPIALVGTSRDITDRKKVEEALRESEHRWSTTLSSIGDAVIATDTNGKITFMNPVAEQLTGWQLSEVNQKPVKQVFNVINEHSRKSVEDPVTKVLQNGVVVGLANHTVLIRKDGSEVPIDDSGAPIVSETGRINGVVLIFRDITERKRTEDVLARQAALIDLSPDAIIVRKLDGTITLWSKGAEKIYGWTKQEAVGKSTHLLLKTQFPEPFEKITAQLLEKKNWTGELVHQTKSGKEVIVQSSWLAEHTEHGQIRSILESNVDVTERKKTEQEIAEAKQRLDAHMNNSPEAVIEFDNKFRVIRWSKQATQVFGWTRDEIAGKAIPQMPWVHPDDVEIVKKVSDDMLNGKTPSNVSSNRNLRKDGSIIDCEWYNSAIYDEKGRLISVLSQVLDVTERKRAEREIARLASFPTLNPEPVIEVNFDGKITFANPATSSFFPDLITLGLNHVFFSNWSAVKHIFEDPDISTFGREVKINNHWYHQQLYRVPNTRQIRIYSTDIDELKQAEEARAKAQTKLEENAVMLEEYASQMEELAEQRAQQLQNAERLAAIGQTAGMVGHDIRNPLQAITGDMYIIAEEVKDMPDGQSKQAIVESLESVNQNLSYINKIVSDLQDYTRPLKPVLQDANLAEMVEGTLLTITVPKGIEVITTVDEKAKPIRTDVAYMRRILTNLMTNAVQAMQDEGRLTVEAHKKKDAIILSVEDTGVGIPDDVKTKMFTPLFTTKSKGQGLGLAVVKRLVDALGGSIAFESTTGKGTKFTVELTQKA